MADRYEAIGCGVYIVDPSAKPDAERVPVACSGDDADLIHTPKVYYAEHEPDDPISKEQEALATRIADALNGSADLLAALKLTKGAIDESLGCAGISVTGWMAIRKQRRLAQVAARTAIAKAEQVTP